MSTLSNKPSVAVMVAVGYKTIIDSLMDALAEAGVKVKIRTKALDVPVMGLVADLDYDGAIRTKVAMPLGRVLAKTTDDDGICSVVLYTFHEEQKYSETCLLWGNSMEHVCPDEGSEQTRLDINGRVYITDYNGEGKIANLEKSERITSGDEFTTIKAIQEGLKQGSYSANRMSEKETFCVTGRSDYRGILENSGPFVVWGNGKGEIIPMCPKRSLYSIVDIALGEKGVAVRALRNGFEAWTDNNTRAWIVPGTKGRSLPPDEGEVMREANEGVPEWLAKQAMPKGSRRRRKK